MVPDRHAHFYRLSKNVGGNVAGPEPTGRETGCAGERASTSS
jgi:hypothetical protein